MILNHQKKLDQLGQNNSVLDRPKIQEYQYYFNLVRLYNNFSIMSYPQRIQISIDSVFQMFARQNDASMMQCDVLRLFNFAFAELGVTRPVSQTEVENFLQQFSLQNKPQITKQDFIQQQFIVFNKPSSSVSQTFCVKIPIQPFVAQLKALGEEVIQRDHIRQFLFTVNEILQIPKPVEESDISKFIADFDRNDDGVLERSDLENIDSLKFMVRKCRRYQ